MRIGAALFIALLAACGRTPAPPALDNALYPGETRALRAMINEAAARHNVPSSLVHRVIQRESDYRADARAGPYWGLMQLLPETAGTMGHRGPPETLLDPATNLEYGVRYLRGAWLVANGDEAEAVMWYARGYYYEARNRCMLVETGLASREIGC
ncbi:MAG: transglycosylase SLT domain-containing protein [Pseudomonadota bacterium]